MGNKDNWYLLDTIQIPSIFAFNISDVQVFNIFKMYFTYSKRTQHVFNTSSTYSERTQHVFYVLNVFYL